MPNKLRYLLYLLFILIGGMGICSAFSAFSHNGEYYIPYSPQVEEKDSSRTKFPVQKTFVENPEELENTNPIDLKTPENIKQEDRKSVV